MVEKTGRLYTRIIYILELYYSLKSTSVNKSTFQTLLLILEGLAILKMVFVIIYLATMTRDRLQKSFSSILIRIDFKKKYFASKFCRDSDSVHFLKI